MGRNVKRVPLDFDWPQDEVWDGYRMPDELREAECSACSGRGSTPALQWVEASAHMILMLSNDLRAQQQGRPMHPYFAEFYTSAYGTRPTPDIAELTAGLAGREPGFLGHDACDGWAATKKIVEAAGLDPETWGTCQSCQGHGSTEKHDGQRAAAEAWEPTEPPTGEGWQMWGDESPMSPVFDAPEVLAAWLADTRASLFGSHTATREQWLKIITGEDFAHVEIAPGVVMM